jgi:ribosomal protein L11 methyltransferase
MGPLLAEFDGEGGFRLWVAIEGDRAGLAHLAGVFRGTGAETREQCGILTALLPAGAGIDRLLVEVTAQIGEVNAAAGREVAAVVETRIVAAGGEGGWEGPFRLGRRFRIAPAGGGHAADEKTILLTASGVFGSGLHPSTRLVVRAVEEIAGAAPFPQRVLDVGTGTGLLAMLAARLGAAAVLGVDIAPEAVAAARGNVAANGLAMRVRIEATPLPEVAGSFDLVLANLTASVQIRLAAGLQARLAAGGELVLSGLLGRQQEEMAGFWRTKGLEVVAEYAEGKWRALRLRAAANGEEVEWLA